MKNIFKFIIKSGVYFLIIPVRLWLRFAKIFDLHMKIEINS